jgi:hypothetical protein
MQVNLAVQWRNKLFEIASDLGQYAGEEFFGLFWGEQQPFVSSGYGGLYFFGGNILGALPRLRGRLGPSPGSAQKFLTGAKGGNRDSPLPQLRPVQNPFLS